MAKAIAETEFEKLLQKATKQKPQQKGEDRAAYIKRIAAALFKLPDEKQDAVYGKLDKAGEIWYNNAVTAVRAKKALPDFSAKLKAPKVEDTEAEEEPAEDESAEETESEADPFDDESAEESDDSESAEEETEESESAEDSEESEDDPFAEETEEEPAEEESESEEAAEETDGAEDFEDNDEPAEEIEEEPPARKKAPAPKPGKAAKPAADKGGDEKAQKAAAKAVREMLINSCHKILPKCNTNEGAQKVLEACRAKLEKGGHKLNPANEATYFYGTIAVLQILDAKGMLQNPGAE